MSTQPTKTLSLMLTGHVTMPVTGTLVIAVPVDATEEEIHGLIEELEELNQEWEGEYGSEDPEYVTGTGEMEIDEVEDDDPEFTFVRNAEGKLVLKE